MENPNSTYLTIIQRKVVYFYTIGFVLILASMAIGTIIYGKLFAGNFVMSFDPIVTTVQSIHISEHEIFEPSVTTLSVDSSLQKSTTYTSIALDEIIQSEGHFIDSKHEYMAYSVYVQNTGSETITIDYYMRLTTVYNWMDEYIRILIIEDNESSQMYQKADQKDEYNNLPIYDQLPVGIDFLSTSLICRESFHDFKPGEIKSFRVIIWLEKQDPNMIDSQLSGSIEAQLVFTIQDQYQAGSSQITLSSNENEEIWFRLTQICVVTLNINYEAEDQS